MNALSCFKLLECCGNLCDACSLAVKFALAKTALPKLIVKADDEGQVEIETSSDTFDVQKLYTQNVP